MENNNKLDETTLNDPSLVHDPLASLRGPAELTGQFGRIDGDCNASINWQRGPRVVLDITMRTPKPILGFLFAGINSITLPGIGRELPIIPTNIQSKWSETDGGECAIQAIFSGAASYGTGHRLSKVVSSVINFANIEYFAALGGNQVQEANEFLLNDGYWCITITRAIDHKNIYLNLEKFTDYAVTHNLVLTRSDGSHFDADELNDALHMLFAFLSFVSGRYVNVFLPVGFANEIPAWWSWGRSIVDSWKAVPTWIDTFHAEVVADVFNKFSTLWRSGTWRTTLRDVVHWYVASNKNIALLETSVVLSQNSLDLLAWETLVQHEHKLTAAKYKELSVDERIRRLLVHCNIPPEIPPEMIGLHDLAQTLGWPDLPKAISEIRHSIVHPDNKSRQSIANSKGHVYDEAWLCAQWMLELSILSILKFNGVYADRRSRGKLEGVVSAVPWAP